MNKVGRALASAAAIGLTLVAAGCSSNVIGADGPQPGVAAQVEGTEISLDELTEAVDGICTLVEADPTAVATSRSYQQAQLLQFWVGALVAIAYADDEGIDVSPPDSGLEQAAGWDEVDEDDVDALRSYVDDYVLAQTIQQSAQEQGAEVPDPADYDVSINPRFDIKLEDNAFVPADAQLSVPVSDEAAVDTEAPTNEELRDLPDEELCGNRPAAQPSSPIPLGG